MLLYHHCTDLENVVFREIKGDIKYSDFSVDDFYKGAYLWIEKQVGFYPLFLAVGETEEDIRMTGYQNQWTRLLSKSPNRREYRKKREFPNYVLFSFQNIDGIFMDYDNWHFVLGKSLKDAEKTTDYEKKLIFKPSWNKAKWLRKAKKEQHSVQLITSSLYLPDAKRIWVRNKKTKNKLEDIGFKDVEIKRLLTDKF